MFMLLNSFLIIFLLNCGSCYNIRPEDDYELITTINTKINFLHEAINLPAGVSEEDLNKIKETLYTYDNYFMEIEKGAEYCTFEKQTNNCTTKLENLKQDLLNEIQILERQKRENSQFSFKPNFSKCLICMNLFANRMRNVLDDYVVHFKLVFMIDKKGDASDSDPMVGGNGQTTSQKPDTPSPTPSPDNASSTTVDSGATDATTTPMTY